MQLEDTYRAAFADVDNPIGKLSMMRDMLAMRAKAPSGQVLAWEVGILAEVATEALDALKGTMTANAERLAAGQRLLALAEEIVRHGSLSLDSAEVEAMLREAEIDVPESHGLAGPAGGCALCDAPGADT